MSFLRTLSRLRQVARNHPPGGILIPNEAMEDFRDLRSRQQYALRARMAEAARQGNPWSVGGGDLNTYVVTSGSIAVSTSAKFFIALTTGAAVGNVWLGFDVSQDAVLSATTAASTVDLRAPTAAFTAGTAATLRPLSPFGPAAAATTGVTQPTAEGGTPVTLCSFFVPVTSGLSYQFPMGRELAMGASSFRDIRVTGATGVACNGLANIYIAE